MAYAPWQNAFSFIGPSGFGLTPLRRTHRFLERRPLLQLSTLTSAFIARWQIYWARHSDNAGLGRIAAWLAVRNTSPYHGRAFLANLNPDGFIVHNSSFAHPSIRTGAHVYVGDRVIASCEDGGGRVELADRVQLYGDTLIQTGAGGSISIGADTHIQPGCHLHAFLSDIIIGRNVEIAAGCAFYSYDHGFAGSELIMKQPLNSKGAISVGDGVWLGHAVTILAGVHIGDGAVIGAGAVVTRHIPSNAIAVGVPARIIKRRQSVHQSSSL